MTKVRAIWQRYLAWRRAEGVAPSVAPESTVINKIDADEGDVIMEGLANRGAGWSSSA